MGQRSVAIGPDGNPHVAYGGKQLYYAWYDGLWHLDVVDPAEGVGQYTSLALDSQSRPHISYYDSTNGDLKYAYFDGAAWQVQVVDSDGDVGRHTSLALDAADLPHISYYDVSDGDLKYAVSDGATWQSWHIDQSGDVGLWNSLALDSAGRPQISYYNSTDGDLKFAYYDGATWQVGTIESGGDVGSFSSLALDSMDWAHVSYYDATNHRLKYGYWDGTTWQLQFVDQPSTGWYTSLALDSADTPHISYCHWTASIYIGDFCDSLKYAYWDGASWQSQFLPGAIGGYEGYFSSIGLNAAGEPRITFGSYTHPVYGTEQLQWLQVDGGTWHGGVVDLRNVIGTYSSLAFDAAGYPHISYMDWVRGALSYAHNEGAGWLFESVAPIRSSELRAGRMALDGAGRAHIPYCTFHSIPEPSDHLYYAREEETGWYTTTVDPSPGVGQYSSLALDAAGRPRISYYDQQNSALKYAWFDGTSWYSLTVDSYDWGMTGLYTSLALDPAGQPHISYYAEGLSNGSLRHAWFDGTSWYTETVDEKSGSGLFSSIAVDGQGGIHISYVRSMDALVLMYAYWDGSVWHLTAVDDSADVGQFTSLALDATGQPHISYGDKFFQVHNLKHAYRDLLGWHTEVVALGVGDYNSLALAPSGQACIAYYCEYALCYACRDTAVGLYFVYLPLVVRE